MVATTILVTNIPDSFTTSSPLPTHITASLTIMESTNVYNKRIWRWWVVR
jgi:hypothetical protein